MKPILCVALALCLAAGGGEGVAQRRGGQAPPSVERPLRIMTRAGFNCVRNILTDVAQGRSRNLTRSVLLGCPGVYGPDVGNGPDDDPAPRLRMSPNQAACLLAQRELNGSAPTSVLLSRCRIVRG